LLLARLRERLPDVDLVCVDSAKALMDAAPAGRDFVLLGEDLPGGSVWVALGELVVRGVRGVILLAEQPTPELVEQAIRAGAVDCLPFRDDWLSTLCEVVYRRLADLYEHAVEGQELSVTRLRDQIRQLELRNAQLRELVALDPLTGLYNRRHFNNMLALLFAVAERHDQDLACLMFDLDNFKQVNDELGHAVGDRLLILAARTLKQAVRGSDVAARYGGDEFVALLPQVTARKARALALRASRLFEQALAEAVPIPISVTLSVGVAGRRSCAATTGRALVAAADAALNEAKRRGKSSVIVNGGLATDAS
jgi:diguanylate cyclase (GGDEF)-like protein